jgi:predicted phosphodiesterase
VRCGIIADIHSNLEALTSVLADIDRRGGVDRLWCLGDVVGYGPDPHRCIELLRQREHVGVAGNHDWAAIGKLDTAYFNPDAAAAARWTSSQLTLEDIRYLDDRPLAITEGDFTLVHGSPRQPVWEYLLSADSARQNLAHFQTQFCLVGHSHQPLVFQCRQADSCSLSNLPPLLTLAADRLIINPGAVGQPRDGDSRASYAIYDTDAGSIRHYRVPYDIAATQSKMAGHGLPAHLASRLSDGV